MATPDVRVRLSAEGVSEVVAALRKIRQEGQTNARGAAGDFKALNGVLGETGKLLSGFGAALTVGALVTIGANAARAADDLGETAEAIGANTTELQVLSTVGQQAGIDIGKLRQALGQLASKIGDLRRGEQGAVDLFDQLHLTAKDFEGLDTAQAFELISKRLGPMETGLRKTGIAADFFGNRIGPRLLPLVNQLAQEGLGGLTEKAKEAGTVLDEELIAKAGSVSDGMDVMAQQVQAVATVFVAELQPAIHDTFQILGDELKNAQDGVRDSESGIHVLGAAVNLVILFIASAVDGLFSLLRSVGTVLGGILGVVAAALNGSASQIKFVFGRLMDSLNDQLDEFKKRDDARTKKALAILSGTKLPEPQLPKQPGSGGATGNGAGDGAAAARKRAAEQAALERALLDNELKFRQAARKAEEAEARRAFDQGLTGIAEYYAARKQLIEQGTADEIAALRARVAVEQRLNTDPAAKKLAITNLNAEIQRREKEGAEELLALAEDERKARKSAADERIRFEQQIRQEQGRTAEAAKQSINEQVEAFEKAIAKTGGGFQPGLGPEDLRRALEAGSAFDTQIQQFTRELRDIELRKSIIQAAVEKGLISEVAGQRQILALEADRLPNLERIASLALAAAKATGDPEKIAQAQELALAIDQLGASASEADKILTNLGGTISGELTQGLTEFLAGGEQGFESFGQAALSTISSVVQALRRLLAQAFALKILGFLGSLFGSGGGKTPATGGSDFATAGSFATGGRLGRRSSHGRLAGPGSRKSDSILGLVDGNKLARFSTDEHVINADVATQPGMRSFLEAINAGLVSAPEITRAPQINPKFAEGGAIGDAGSARIDGAVTVGLEQGLVERAIESKAGQEAILRVVSRRSRTIRNAIGRG